MSDTRSGADPRWLYWFLILQFVCQVALMAPLGPLRIGFRALTFASSLAMPIVLPQGGTPHPLRWLAGAFLAMMLLGFLHPQLNTPLSGMASIAINFSIWAPIFWAGRFRIDSGVLGRAILVIWSFHTASAALGVLQVYDPERYAPDSSFVEAMAGQYAEGLKITLDDGRRIYRPFGLTDTPGGASSSGAFAATVGLALVASNQTVVLRIAGALAAIIGMFCIYMCQIRSTLIVTGLGFVLMASLMYWRGRAAKATILVSMMLATVFAAFIWAIAVGSEAVTSRFETLTEDDPTKVYYSNRGASLEETIYEHIPGYPLGAGLGRWGMMYTYFGDPNNPDSPGLWAEIQATAWVYDGGIILLLIGYSAVIAACVMSFRTAIYARMEDLSDQAAIISAMNISSLAATFGYSVFISQGGIMFWVLNGVLFAAVSAESKPSPSLPKPLPVRL
jgi:hypothetical protein